LGLETDKTLNLFAVLKDSKCGNALNLHFYGCFPIFIDIQNHKTGKQIRGISQSAMRILMDYAWPGNVRELENAIEHAFVLCAGDEIDIFDLPVEIRQMEYQPAFVEKTAESERSPVSRKKLSREILLEILDECDWNKAEAGRRVGLSRTAIWKYMKKWDIPLQRS